MCSIKCKGSLHSVCCLSQSDNEMDAMQGNEENSLYICIEMGKIFLKNIRLYAFHGCMDEEEKIGSDYVVNVVVKTNLDTSSQSTIWRYG